MTQSHNDPLGALRINYASPFSSHEDGVQERLEEVHALLTLLAAAHHDADDGPDSVESDTSIEGVRPEIKARAFEGVRTLVAVALCQLELAETERKAGRR